MYTFKKFEFILNSLRIDERWTERPKGENAYFYLIDVHILVYLLVDG